MGARVKKAKGQKGKKALLCVSGWWQKPSSPSFIPHFYHSTPTLEANTEISYKPNMPPKFCFQLDVLLKIKVLKGFFRAMSLKNLFGFLQNIFFSSLWQISACASVAAIQCKHSVLIRFFFFRAVHPSQEQLATFTFESVEIIKRIRLTAASNPNCNSEPTGKMKPLRGCEIKTKPINPKRRAQGSHDVRLITDQVGGQDIWYSFPIYADPSRRRLRNNTTRTTFLLPLRLQVTWRLALCFLFSPSLKCRGGAQLRPTDWYI